MRRRHALGLIAAAVAAQPRGAAAAKSDDTLRIGWRDPPADIDFYHNPLRSGFVLSQHAWDGLIYRDPETFQLKPLLAVAWRQPNDRTIEFDLRPDVKFHNGDPFTADDVAYTINTVLQDDTVAVPSNYTFLAGAERLGDLRVRVNLRHVFPAALEYIAMVLPIWPQRYREQVGAKAYVHAPVGTGPYRITGVDPLNATRLERNDDYFPGSPKGRPAIQRITFRAMIDSDAQVAALLDGQCDWIWDFGPGEFDRIARDPNMQALRADTMRVNYLCMDATGRTGEGNPLTDVRVRQAIACAIDRSALVRDFVQGSARLLDGPCYPTQFGCNQSAAVHYAYDPERSRRLLREAGHGDGFKTELVSYQLASINSAVRDNLNAVGIEARVTQMQTAPAIQAWQAGQTPLFMGSWGSYSINDVSAFMPFFFDGGPQDYARDIRVQQLVADGGGTTDPDQRRAYYAEAIHRITENAYWLPLFTVVKTYGFTRALNFRPYPDELPRFYLASWK